MQEFEELAHLLEQAGLKAEAHLTRKFARDLKLPSRIVDVYAPQINELKMIAEMVIDSINPQGKDFEERRRMITGLNRFFHDMVMQIVFPRVRVKKETIETHITSKNLSEAASFVRNAFSKTLSPSVMPTHILPGKANSAEWPVGIITPREIGVLTDMYSLSGQKRKTGAELQEELGLGAVAHIRAKGLETMINRFGRTVQEKGFVEFETEPWPSPRRRMGFP